PVRRLQRSADAQSERDSLDLEHRLRRSLLLLVERTYSAQKPPLTRGLFIAQGSFRAWLLSSVRQRHHCATPQGYCSSMKFSRRRFQTSAIGRSSPALTTAAVLKVLLASHHETRNRTARSRTVRP